MLTATLENVLNRGLPRSPRARQLVASLAGRRLAVLPSPAARSDAPRSLSTPAPGSESASPPAAAWNRDPQLLIESDGLTLKLQLTNAAELLAAPPDATIIGGPFSLLALSGSTPEAVIQRGDVRIEGDAELAQKFQELFKLLQPDLEEELSLLVGDVPAHQLGRLTRAALGFARRAARTTVQNAAEYLAHERRDLVPRAEAEQFLRGVDTLRDDVDRLAARIDLMKHP